MCRRVGKIILLVSISLAVCEVVFTGLVLLVCKILIYMAGTDIPNMVIWVPDVAWETLPISFFIAMTIVLWASISVRLEGRK